MRILALVLLLCLTACSTPPDRLVSSALPVSVESELNIAIDPPAQALNVGIKVFDVEAVDGS